MQSKIETAASSIGKKKKKRFCYIVIRIKPYRMTVEQNTPSERIGVIVYGKQTSTKGYKMREIPTEKAFRHSGKFPCQYDITLSQNFRL